MPKSLQVLTDIDEIQAVLRNRKKTFVEKTVSASSLELAKKKAEVEVDDGWEVLRENKSSVRLKKPKPIDEVLEDEVWCLLAQMGFDELSRDRQFKIAVGKDIPPRQIDVFAKDDDCVLLIECTSCKTRKRKSLSNLIEKIVSIRKNVFNSVRSHYGHDSKLKMKWGIATKNIEWSEVDISKCKENNIFIISDINIVYFKKLVSHLKGAAKFQLLSTIFRDEQVNNLSLQVPASKGKMGSVNFYNFLIKPHDLLKIAYISHKKGDDLDDLNTYQRMLQPGRLKNIGKYIDEGGQFPTNIVLNLKSDKVRFDKKDDVGSSAYGTLYLPNSYASAWIIDGQHRLYGYSHSERSQKKSKDTTVFPVLAYENLDPSLEAQMFIDINCEQVKVSRNLLNEIYAGLKWDSPDFKERMEGLYSRIAITLNNLSTSPIYDRIKTTTSEQTETRCLTLNSLVDALKENKFFGELNRDGSITHGPLSASYDPKIQATLEKSTLIIEFYLCLFRDEIKEQWALGSGKGGFLFTNNGLRALFRVLREILSHVAYHDSVDLHKLPPEDFFVDIKKYTQPLLDFLKNLNFEGYAILRGRQALKGVSQNTMDFLAEIHSAYPEFHPNKLAEYLESIDKEGTKEAQNLIDSIQDIMHKFVLFKLREHLKDDWWYEGIPEKIRRDCQSRRESEKGAHEPHKYLFLIDYQAIASQNWKIFEPFFTINKDGGKDKKLYWIKELNDIRRITHHVEKWPATKDQVTFVRDIYRHVNQNFIIND